METNILEAYRAERTNSKGQLPELSIEHHKVAKLAASYTESELRLAAAMRGSYERQQRKQTRRKA
ncbi:hypothetical protein Dolphis_54 [Pseudomonas phage Dolphis]|nr:hypothetical protein Dolphis_54 [Pseudomonas phage Dolphis]